MIWGLVPLTNGSGSGPALFVSDLQDAKKIAYYFLKVYLNHSSKIKRHKEVTKKRNQFFSSYFCLMMEGSLSGYIPLNNGSGPKNLRNLQIWNRNNGLNILLQICTRTYLSY
jgi:hypothetical protein